MERHPSRRLETRICIPILSLAGLPHTVVQVVDCPNLGSTLHIEVCVDGVPEVVQCITIFGTLTHYLPLGSNNKRTSRGGTSGGQTTILVVFIAPGLIKPMSWLSISSC